MYKGTPNNISTNMLDKPDVLTKIGKFLRKTSIDELPQLFIKRDLAFSIQIYETT